MGSRRHQDRAISLVDAMLARIAGLTHVNTLAFGRLQAAMFEIMRGARSRGALHAAELTQLAAAYDLPFFGAFGVFLEGWAR